MQALCGIAAASLDDVQCSQLSSVTLRICSLPSLLCGPAVYCSVQSPDTGAEDPFHEAGSGDALCRGTEK